MEKTGVLVHHLCDEHAPKCSILTCQTHALWVKHALKHYHLSVFLPSTYVLLPPPPLPSFDKVSHNLDWPWTCYVGEDDFELFLLPLECWECRHAPLCSVVCGAGDWTPRLHAWYSTNWVILNLHPSFLLWKTIVTMRWGGVSHAHGSCSCSHMRVKARGFSSRGLHSKPLYLLSYLADCFIFLCWTMILNWTQEHTP